jgi:hypothetical protein
MADDGILKAYSLSSQDVRADPLLDLSVGRKLALFRKMDAISTEDFNIVCQFKDKRNYLFHRGGLFFLSIQHEEKEQIMDVGERVVDIMEKLDSLLGGRQGDRRVYLRKEKGDNCDK